MKSLILSLGLIITAAADSLPPEAKEVLDAVRVYRSTRNPAVLDTILKSYVKRPDLPSIFLSTLPVDEHTRPILIRLISDVPSNSGLKKTAYLKLTSGPESVDVVKILHATLLNTKEDTDVRIAALNELGGCQWISAQMALIEVFDLIGEEQSLHVGKWRDRMLGNMINGKHLDLSEKLLAAYERHYPTASAKHRQHKESIEALRIEISKRKDPRISDQLAINRAMEERFSNLTHKTNTISRKAAGEQLANFPATPVLQRLELVVSIMHSEFRDGAILQKMDELVGGESSGIIKSMLILSVANGLPEAERLFYLKKRLADDPNPEVKSAIEMQLQIHERIAKGKAK